MGHYFKWIGSPEQARELWENSEAMGKYLAQLKKLMMADPDARMTEDETREQAAERARVYNLSLKEKSMKKIDGFPRRGNMEHMTAEEKMILNCIIAIEKMPHADTKLTMAQVRLQEAKDFLSDWIDEQED